VGWTEKLADGRWRAWESEGSGPDRLRATAVRSTKRAAQDAASSRLEQKRRGADVEPHKLTLKVYLEKWLEHEVTQGRPPHSVACDRAITNQLPAQLQQTRLTQLRPIVLQRWLDGTSDRSPNTVRKRYKRLHAALAKAKAWRLIAENPLDSVTPPKPQRTQMKALSESETAALLRSLEGTRYWAPALVAVTTGVRQGELLRLRWDDVDTDEVVLRMLRTKSGDGKPATLTLMAVTVECLKEHRRQQAAERLASRKWHDQGLVFPGRSGSSWQQSTFAGGWLRLQTGVRFHDLRHTHATQMLRAGVRLDAVSKRLGHASSAVTAQVYSHVLADDDALAVSRLEASLGDVLGADSGT
jgi:integrase